jgi:hypothetical protein
MVVTCVPAREVSGRWSGAVMAVMMTGVIVIHGVSEEARIQISVEAIRD